MSSSTQTRQNRLSNASTKLRSMIPNPSLDSGTTKGAAAVAGVAAAAGVAFAAYKKFAPTGSNGTSPNGTSSNGTSQKATSFHVQPTENGWKVQRVGSSDPEQSFPTKAEAVSTGRKIARGAEPSELFVHRTDGTVERQHAYGAS